MKHEKQRALEEIVICGLLGLPLFRKLMVGNRKMSFISLYPQMYHFDHPKPVRDCHADLCRKQEILFGDSAIVGFIR